MENSQKADWVRRAVSKYEMRLVRYTSRLVPEAHAREIVQETFLRLWQQEYKEIGDHLAEWLYTVCRNQAIDARRKNSHAEKSEVEEVAYETPEDKTAKAQEQGSLLKLVAKLPLEQQEVIRLKFQDDLSYKEISAITGHSISYVGVLIHTAVTTMREKYGAKK